MAKRLLYNVRTFSDVELILTDEDPIYLSRYHLSRSSTYFRWLFRIYPSVRSFHFPLPKKEKECFIYLLKLIYEEEESPPMKYEKKDKENETSATNNEDIYFVHQVALKFDIPEIFKNYTASIDEISRLEYFLENLTELGAGNFSLNLSVTKLPAEFKASLLFREKSSVIINNQFKNITDILDHKREFLILHATGLEFILKNENFQQDSENSILTIIMMWIRENRTTREKYLKNLLPLVDMHEMTNFFLINLVPSVIQELEDKELKENICGAYIQA